MAGIFLSYRRKDSAAITGRIFDRLVGHFGRQAVIMDIDNIPYGKDFRTHVAQTLEKCDVILAIIGPQWLGLTGERKERIDRPTDWVRIELETGLRRKIPVIPLLVEEASMPSADRLPPSLHDFAYYHGAEIDSGVDFHVHMDRLIRHVDQLLQEGEQRKATAGTMAVSPAGDEPVHIAKTPPPDASVQPAEAEVPAPARAEPDAPAPPEADDRRDKVPAAASPDGRAGQHDGRAASHIRPLWVIVGFLLVLAAVLGVGLLVAPSDRDRVVSLGRFEKWVAEKEIPNKGKIVCQVYYDPSSDGGKFVISLSGGVTSLKVYLEQSIKKDEDLGVYLDDKKIGNYDLKGSDYLFLRDGARDFLDTIKAGATLKLVYDFDPSGITSQSYALAGLSKALRAMDSACGAS